MASHHIPSYALYAEQVSDVPRQAGVPAGEADGLHVGGGHVRRRRPRRQEGPGGGWEVERREGEAKVTEWKSFPNLSFLKKKKKS